MYNCRLPIQLLHSPIIIVHNKWPERYVLLSSRLQFASTIDHIANRIHFACVVGFYYRVATLIESPCIDKRLGNVVHSLGHGMVHRIIQIIAVIVRIDNPVQRVWFAIFVASAVGNVSHFVANALPAKWRLPFPAHR